MNTDTPIGIPSGWGECAAWAYWLASREQGALRLTHALKPSNHKDIYPGAGKANYNWTLSPEDVA